MFRPSQIQDYIDYNEEHNDYFVLINEYSEAVLYKEIIHFMNIAFPEWNSNAGIGSWAAEFVLTAIQNLEYTEEKEYTLLKTLKEMYVTLADDYNSFKEKYQFIILDDILKQFNIEYGEFLDEHENLSEKDFEALYEELYATYRNKYFNVVTYSFIEND
ncbi:hypothetical protein JM658_11895 [Joostella atrarenae]|uniref:DUF4375 domain-containing protein n=1 Tax=Joostella atrarenae TaxID=679257 RepID=A0ABS9J5B8_9FLAO|nr:hypothetical protein [Joostella atrarenae]MCF8715528.1 hypothetical protein [Joostella atrarenae]